LVRSYKGLRAKYEDLPEPIRTYLVKLAPLLDSGNDYDIALAYCFMKIEEGHHRALYGGMIKMRKCDKAYAKVVVSKEHMTREHFKSLFKNIFGKPLNESSDKHHQSAAKVRDGLIHGKTPSPAELRIALSESMDYIHTLNEQIKEIALFEPYGNMQGALSKATVTDHLTSVWIAKGIGFKS
jgi:hypothetical protein